MSPQGSSMAKSSQAVSSSKPGATRPLDPVGRLPQQPWMTSPESTAVMAALTSAGGKARFVGGCVRDAALGRPVKDVDIATTVRPDDVRELMAKAGIRVIPIGIDHGTVAAIVNHAFFEITTLRRDVETDGRHARVEYTDDWAADASRRDLTVNALYCAPDGTLYDPIGGLPDLKAGIVRFVGNPSQRIREDVLRILRFFRFYAYYGVGRPDKASLAACTDLAPMLPNLSAERIAAETLKMLAAPDPVPTFDLMLRHEVLPHFLPEAVNHARLAGLVAVERLRPPGLEAVDPLLRLAAVIVDLIFYADKVAQRLKLSNAQRSRLVALGEAPPITPEMDRKARRRAYFKLGPALFRDCIALGWAEAAAEAGGIGRTRTDAWFQLLNEAAMWTQPVFPVTGKDALALGIPEGPKIGRLLEAVQSWWVEQDFAPDRDACLAKLRSLSGVRG